MSNKIHFLLTGGTIDAFYNPVQQTATPSPQSIIPYYFSESIKPYLDLSFEQICMKDSKDVTDEDKANLIAALKKTEHKQIIITHGTDKMPELATFVKEQLGPDMDKTIIITGSIIPMEGFTRSDSGFNLGFALAKMSHLDSGIYICMNARIFDVGNVIKNFELARFEEK